MFEHLTAAQLAELRARLEVDRARLLRRAGLPVGGPADARDVEPSDLQDKAAQEASRRAQLSLDARDRAQLGEIDDALARMEDGTYGICEETGEPIPLARLRLEPTTRYTVEALELLEDERARERTKHREEDEGTAY